MQDRYWLYQRENGVFYLQDKLTGKQESLKTRNAAAANRLLAGKNQSVELPMLNRSMAKTYLAAKSPELMERTWADVISQYVNAGVAESRDRKERAFRSQPFMRLLKVKLLDTEADHLFAVLEHKKSGNAQNYRPGLVVQFHQNVHGVTRGQRVTVSSVNSDGSIHVQDEKGREQPLPLYQSARFQVYEARTLPLAPGDKIRITQNGFTADGKCRLNNGAVYPVKAFTKAGDLKLSNGWVIGKNHGNLAHGYCQTSHVAQSKTVDRVFVAQSAASLGASSAEQFYVSVSRARESITVYTDDKTQLAKAIQSNGVRMTAHELLKLPVPTKRDDPFDLILRDKGIVPFDENTAIKSTPQKAQQTRKVENIETARLTYLYRNRYFTRPAAQGHKMSL